MLPIFAVASLPGGTFSFSASRSEDIETALHFSSLSVPISTTAPCVLSGDVGRSVPRSNVALGRTSNVLISASSYSGKMVLMCGREGHRLKRIGSSEWNVWNRRGRLLWIATGILEGKYEWDGDEEEGKVFI